MKIYFSIILFILVLLNSICFADLKRNNNNLSFSLEDSTFKMIFANDSLMVKQKLKTKIPELAAVIAIFPGIFMHGFGHLYAGKYLTWGYLMIATMVGYYLLSIEDAYLPYEGADLRDKRYHYFDRIYYSARILFFGSWAYDIIGAPIICARHNKRLKQKLFMNPYFEKNQLGNQIGIQLNYHF